jgi:hypothetical protein
VKQVASVLTNTVVDVVIVVDYRKTEQVKQGSIKNEGKKL